MNRRRYELRYFYDLHEVLASSPTSKPWQVNAGDRILSLLEDMQYLPNFVKADYTDYKDDNYRYLINLMYQLNHKDYVINSDEDTLTTDMKYDFIFKLCGAIISTSDRYLSLLASYVAAKDKLLAPLKTTTNSSNRFNDTPQEGGDYSLDPFTSSINQIESSTEIDSDTIMGRLRELQGNYQNVLRNWVDEVSKIFIEGGNI